MQRRESKIHPAGRTVCATLVRARDTEEMLRVFSIYKSIQGESSRAGLPCGFVRLAGCPLFCSYCDTPDARDADGKAMTVEQVVLEATSLGTMLVEVTGGEPLAQDATPSLLTALADAGREVMLETNGAFPVDEIDSRVRVILDIKCPGSGMSDRMNYGNLDALAPGRHEVKFVVSSLEDFTWAVELCRKKKLTDRVEVLISPVSGEVEPSELAEWIIGSGERLRMQLQLHKIIWSELEGER